jgi:YbbR domain-containing protein
MSLWRRLRNNLGLKLLSLLTALIIWGTVQTQTDPVVVRRKTLKVVPINVPQGLASVSIEPSQLTLTLVGRVSAFARLEAATPRLVANAAQGAVGSLTAVLRVEDLPAGLQIREWPRTAAAIVLDNLVSRTRPIYVEVRGRPAVGFAAGNWQARPNEVTLRGASSVLQRVERVVAEVDISGLSTTLTAEAPLAARDVTNVPLADVNLEPAQTTVTVSLRQVNSKTVPIAPVITGPPEGYEIASVTVNPPVVTLTGGSSSLAEAESVSTGPLDARGIRSHATLTAALRLPAGCAVVGAASVRVTITVRPARGHPDGTPPGSPPATAKTGEETTPATGEPTKAEPPPSGESARQGPPPAPGAAPPGGERP